MKILRLLQSLLRLIGAVLGRINTFLLMVISFYLMVLPMGLIRRLFVRRNRTPRWHSREPLGRKHFEKQY